MGAIKKILEFMHVGTPPHNNRFTVDLCENVHIHYRNLRLEFPPYEFIQLLTELQKININDIKGFDYSNDSFKELVHIGNLPNKTEFNDRLQIEEQVNGQTHIHYRNLRLEF